LLMNNVKASKKASLSDNSFVLANTGL